MSSPVATGGDRAARPPVVVCARIARSSAADRIVDHDVEHEPIELRLRQRIGAFLLDRILRGQHEQRTFERMAYAADRHLILLHRLEQRRLRLRRRAVDLVGQDDVGEDGPGDEPNRARPVARSSSITSVPVMSDGIRSGVNWMRLNLRWTASASVLISSVLASPGTPRSRQWPPARNAVRISVMTAAGR